MPKRYLLNAKVAFCPFCLFKTGKGSCWEQADAHVAFSARGINSGAERRRSWNHLGLGSLSQELSSAVSY